MGQGYALYKRSVVCRQHWEHCQRQDAADAARIERLTAKLKAGPPPLEEALRLLKGGLWGIKIVPDDFQPLPDGPQTEDGRAFCGECLGHRYLSYAELGHSTGWQSDIRRCPACLNEDRPTRLNRVAERAGLEPGQRAKTFANFKPDKGAMEATAAAAVWAQQPSGWLVIHGVPGSGKTHLALAAANVQVNAEREFRWYYAPDLAEAVKELMQAQMHHLLLADLKRVPILFLDDLGAVRPTDFVIAEILEPLFNHRYEANLPTFVTCLGDPEALKEYFGPSIGRRMQDASVSRVVHNAAPQWGL